MSEINTFLSCYSVLLDPLFRCSALNASPSGSALNASPLYRCQCQCSHENENGFCQLPKPASCSQVWSWAARTRRRGQYGVDGAKPYAPMLLKCQRLV
ncbi:hypothetical protein OUZ56_032303 [Daphnia magna]|uniref:Secreted protein n=1 Tax=Daphnia magna TaxID=35525 RepID=A0ABQ9ZWT5_9CRUS|nr:hypothetical protein OUZ56_032303 [Daphnia magna]